MVNEAESYWSMRAKNEYLYKGEKLYTITAAPYYVKRREIIIKKLKNIITKYDCRRIVDVGCGDGEYLLKICDENKKYHGIDILTEMLKEAVKNCKDHNNISFELSERGTQKFHDYDMAYAVAVLAHVSDETMENLLKNIYEGMEDKGKICICEQTAPYEFSGNGWKRRSFETYRDALEKQGFKCMIHETFRIDFGIHRKLFERHIAKKFLSEKSRIECNKNRVYLFLSRLCVFLSFKRLYHNKLNGWGYIFITAEK